MGVLTRNIRSFSFTALRCCGTTSDKKNHACKLLIVGGGTGGCSTAWRFARRMAPKDIIVLEPSEYHYYQPLFTLVAAGLKRFGASRRATRKVMPKDVRLLVDSVAEFEPDSCSVTTANGERIDYDYLVVAMGLENQYHLIPGLRQALDCRKSGVNTVYSPEYCCKCWKDIRNWRGGHALFTFTSQASKCAGAAQKSMYLADDYWRKRGVRSATSITYCTGGTALFGVARYARTLDNVTWARGLAVNTKAELTAIEPTGAVFTIADGKKVTIPYNYLHVTPPMAPPDALRTCGMLTTPEGFLNVDKYTLQHKHFANVYGIGDCTSTPNSKTAAAVACQSHVLEQNLLATMDGKLPPASYSGYGACPLLTSYQKGIMAEFLYDKKLQETLPVDQSVERRLIYFLKTRIMPTLYWHGIITGKWNGPARLRKMINPFGK